MAIKNKKWLYFLPLIVSLIVIISISITNDNLKEKNLKSVGKITSAKIIKVSSGYKGGGANFTYEFKDENNNLIRNNFASNVLPNDVKFLNKKFPVIYNPKKSDENEILMRKVHFEKYNMLFPDSLQWVQQYEN